MKINIFNHKDKSSNYGEIITIIKNIMWIETADKNCYSFNAETGFCIDNENLYLDQKELKAAKILW